MKKNIGKIFTLCVMTAAFVSCASSKPAQPSSADVYVTEEDAVKITTGSEKTSSENQEASNEVKPVNPLAKDKNAFQEFFTFGNGDDYYKFDETTLFVKEITGLKEKKVTNVIRTDNLMAGWGSAYMAAYYFVQFDQQNRAALAKAVNLYFSDFDNKRLQRKGKNTDRAYGKITYRIDWGTISSSTPNNGTGQGYVGYEFVKGSPYFTISNFPFENDYYERSGGASTRESMQLKYYFTRAQLSRLLKILSEDNLSQLIYGNTPGVILNPTEADSYEN